MARSLLPDSLLEQVDQVINAHLGLRFSDGRRANLENGLKEVAAELGFAGAEECARWLTTTDLTSSQLQLLADHLTIGETYFFREAHSLNWIKDNILPDLIAQRAQQSPGLRFWSAGCSTGEEPYSLAILLDRYFPQVSNWPVTILATDINARFLQKARQGIYRKWSFRNTPQWVLRQYFSYVTESGRYVLHQRIKRDVSFAQLNLVEFKYPSLANGTHNMDVILCRNVFIYFNQQTINQVVDRFVQTLNPDGWLIVGPSEAAYLKHPQLQPVATANGTIFKKGPVQTLRRAQPAQLQRVHPVASPSAVPANLSVEPPARLRPEPPARLRPEPPAQTDILHQATRLLEQNNYQQAVVLLQNALSSGQDVPETPALLTMLAQAFANQGKLEQARAWIEKAIQADKLSPNNYYLLGNILQEQNQLNDAQKAFKRALFLDPDCVMAHFALGNLLRKTKHRAQANRHYKAARSILSRHPGRDVLPASGGLTVSELTQLLESLM